jgi:uncharacterized protein involved in propanediol utilization
LASQTGKRPEDSEEEGEGSAFIGSATVRAPGACGELAQGVIEGIHFLVTCPVDFYSRVKVDLYSDGPGNKINT